MKTQELEYPRLQALLNEYGDLLIDLYKRNLGNSNATGELANTLSYEVTDDNSVYEVSLKLQDYWKYLEYGRKAGKMPPINDIKQWIQVKRIVPKANNGKLPTTEQLAYLIARDIGRFGTIGKYPLEKSITELDALDTIDQAITEDLNEQVTNVIKL